MCALEMLHDRRESQPGWGHGHSHVARLRISGESMLSGILDFETESRILFLKISMFHYGIQKNGQVEWSWVRNVETQSAPERMECGLI